MHHSLCNVITTKLGYDFVIRLAFFLKGEPDAEKSRSASTATATTATTTATNPSCVVEEVKAAVDDAMSGTATDSHLNETNANTHAKTERRNIAGTTPRKRANY